MFLIYNSRSHVNLEQDEVRRQDVLNSFQAKIQSDIDVLRNLTYRALEQQSQSRLSSFILLLFILVMESINRNSVFGFGKFHQKAKNLELCAQKLRKKNLVQTSFRA